MIGAGGFRRVSAFGKQVRELACGFDGFGIVLRGAYHDTAWMQIVVQRMAFT